MIRIRITMYMRIQFFVLKCSVFSPEKSTVFMSCTETQKRKVKYTQIKGTLSRISCYNLSYGKISMSGFFIYFIFRIPVSTFFCFRLTIVRCSWRILRYLVFGHFIFWFGTIACEYSISHVDLWRISHKLEIGSSYVYLSDITFADLNKIKI